jgi:hypothetical protein
MSKSAPVGDPVPDHNHIHGDGIETDQSDGALSVERRRHAPALACGRLEAPEAMVRGNLLESGAPLRENARRNHTLAPRTETPSCKRERL